VKRTIVLIALLSVGCVKGAVTVGKPTALELQLLGVYDELDKDLVHAGSVRANPTLEIGGYEKLEAEAIEARSVQRFNEDDVGELKSQGCFAEGLSAKLIAHGCDAVADAAVGRRRDRILGEENKARAVILTWAAYNLSRQAGRPAPKPDEVEEVRKAYQRLLHDAAKPGHLLETAPGRVEPVGR
jgi:hypothetical protein